MAAQPQRPGAHSNDRAAAEDARSDLDAGAIDLTGIVERRPIPHRWWDVMRDAFVRDARPLEVARREPRLRLEPAEELVFFTDGSAYRFIDEWSQELVYCSRSSAPAPRSN